MVKRNPANHSVGEYGEIIMQWSSKTGKKICDVVEALNTGQANSKRNINSYKSSGVTHQGATQTQIQASEQHRTEGLVHRARYRSET
jgi:hypothetical protein